MEPAETMFRVLTDPSNCQICGMRIQRGEEFCWSQGVRTYDFRFSDRVQNCRFIFHEYCLEEAGENS